MSKNEVLNFQKQLDTKKIKEGIFFDMPNKEYHSLDGLSSTQFQDLDLSVAIYENRHLFKYDCEAFRIGTLNHTALLEPHLLSSYIETTTKTFESEVTKKLIEQNPDKEVVALGSIELAKERAEKVRLVYGNFVDRSLKEVSFIVFDKDLKLYRKCRADMWLPKDGIVLDYKTSKETNHNGFERVIEVYNYHISCSWYIDTINMCIEKFNLPYPKVTQFGWIVSPNYAPYKPFGFVASIELIEKGREDYQRLTNKLLEVRKTGKDYLFKEAHSLEYKKKQREVY